MYTQRIYIFFFVRCVLITLSLRRERSQVCLHISCIFFGYPYFRLMFIRRRCLPSFHSFAPTLRGYLDIFLSFSLSLRLVCLRNIACSVLRHTGNFMVTYSYIILPFIKYIAYSMPGDLAVSMSLYLSEYAKKCKCIFACVDTDREIIRQVDRETARARMCT